MTAVRPDEASSAAAPTGSVLGGRRQRRAEPQVARIDFRNPSRPTGARLAALETFGRSLGVRLAAAFTGLLQERVSVEGGRVRSGTFPGLAAADPLRATALVGPDGAIGALVYDEALEEHLSLRLLGVPPAPDEPVTETPELPSTLKGGTADAAGETAGSESPTLPPSRRSERTPMVRAALRSATSAVLGAANEALAGAGCGSFRVREPAGLPERALAGPEAAHAFDVAVREGKAGGTLALVLPERAIRPILATPVRDEPRAADPVAARRLEAIVRGLELGVRARLGSTRVALFEEILHLQVGDVLVLDRRLGEPVELLAGGRALFEGHLGTARGRLGVRLTARAQE